MLSPNKKKFDKEADIDNNNYDNNTALRGKGKTKEGVKTVPDEQYSNNYSIVQQQKPSSNMKKEKQKQKIRDNINNIPSGEINRPYSSKTQDTKKLSKSMNKKV